MKIGVSCALSGVEQVAAAGYDFIELAMTEIVALSDEAFEALRQKKQTLNIQVEVVNCFFGAEPALVGPKADFEAVRAYAHRALARAAQLGVQIAVFGSGRQRSVPEGCDRAAVLAQIERVVRILGQEGQRAGILICVEHLRPAEDNTLTTLGAALELVRRIDHPGVRALVDFFHLEQAGESLETVCRSGGLLYHAHIAVGDDRHCPREEDRGVLLSWRRALDACGYDGRVTVESLFSDFDAEIRAARPVLQIFK